ncbi:MAG: DNA polymerase III subunit alpha [Candidatus Kapabacteria bacterium]|nr:DNA polymerase III subunit alpha [Candidatus Kapabacteria bacterium]
MSSYVHLHNHTHYSLLDAATTPSQLIDAAIADGQEAIALTDHGNMFGAVEFFNYAKKKSIKPIIGMEGYISVGSRFERIATNKNEKIRNYFHILLLAKNQQGYKNLIKLSSLAYTEGFYYRPRIDKELLEKYHEGLICTSACMGSMVNAWILDGNYEKAYSEAKYYKDMFGDDFYLEIQNHGLENDPLILEKVPRMARELDIKMTVSNDIHYLKPEHAIAHNVLLSIKDANPANGKFMNILELRYGKPEFYFKSSEQMKQLFKDYPDAIANTVEIADKCNFEIDKTRVFPDFPLPKETEATNLDDYLRELVYEGLTKKYNSVTNEIRQRVEYELKVIIDMGFSGYFLIVWDFIVAANRLGVRVGPGRGSVVGSVVAYALDITLVDPLPYDLLFERFLNPERFTMPDIDIDFNDEKRGLVIDYVKNKYGEKAVAQIVTFGKLTTKAVITDVGRVLGVDLSTIRKITKLIPVNLGKVTPLEKALELKELHWVKDSQDQKIQDLIEYSLLLENKNRHTGIHAAGIVITKGEITDYVPVYKPKESDEAVVDMATQYSMGELEDVGLLKMDFLGLKTLSIIDHTLDMIEKNHGIRIDLEKIDFEDKSTYDMISEGDTTAIFQFESDGMQEYLKRLKPHNLEELTAMNALYRPGPMESIPLFIDRKHGRKPITLLHPIMEKVLKTTYGIIVYQEQVMQLVQVIGGFSLGQADILRRAMGKKKVKEMESMKPDFVKGAAEKGISKSTTMEIWDLINKFADYGFNKSHAVAYSYLAFQTAWLKAHYRAEFFAANMTSKLNELSQIIKLVDEAEKFGISVVPPDINKSDSVFVVSENKIYFALSALKNIGVSAVQHIVEKRQEKPFASFFDFVRRIDSKFINKRGLESLVCSGAFDSVENNKRRALYDSIELALEFSKRVNDGSDGEESLFGADVVEIDVVEPTLPDVEEWSERERLKHEYEVMNYYVTGHPLNSYEPFITAFSTKLENGDVSNPIGSSLSFCGSVSGIRRRNDSKNNTFAFAEVENLQYKAEMQIWSRTYESFGHLLNENSVLVFRGKLTEIEDKYKVNVEEIYNLHDAMSRYTKGLNIRILVDKYDLSIVNEIKNLLTRDFGTDIKITFNIENKDKSLRKTYAVFGFHAKYDVESIMKLCDLVGSNNVRFELK